MTSGTWARHKGGALSYDVVDLGFNYRLDEPRAALLLSRLSGLQADIADRRRLVARYRALLAGIEGLTIPYRDDDVAASSCYVMPLVLDDAKLQGPLRQIMSDRWGVQTSLLYPSIDEFTAYSRAQPPLPRSRRIARTQVTIPLYPHLTEVDQDRVITAVREGIAELQASGPVVAGSPRHSTAAAKRGNEC